MVKPAGAIVDGRYEVVRFLGQGSFGEVYEVIDRYQGAKVALKFLNSTPGPGGVWEEAQRLTELRGDYILPVCNADFDAGAPYIVTELAPEGSADGKMAPIGVEPRLAVKWTRAACRGAARTHDAGLLHRDIKPGNLFLKTDDRAVLGDFGIACLMDANGEGPFGGTPQTMSPEVAAGGPTSVASDVYSLGATAFALLAGKYAHTHRNGLECMRRVVSDPPPRLRDLAPHVSQALAQRVEKAMARSAADRYRDPAEFDAALGDLPSVSRYWQRTDEHPGHEKCFRGEAKGKADATVCLVPAGSKAEVLVQHQPLGRRIVKACRPAAPPSAHARNLRAAIGAVK